MMMKRPILSAPLALLLLTETALGQTWAILKPPPKADPAKPFAAMSHAVPKGIPGFYDPATRTFTPVSIGQGHIGAYVALAIGFDYHNNPPRGASLIIDWFNSFGALESPSDQAQPSSFVGLQYVSQEADFGAPASKSFSQPFTTQYPVLFSGVTCQIQFGDYFYETTVNITQQAVKSGTTNLAATCTL